MRTVRLAAFTAALAVAIASPVAVARADVDGASWQFAPAQAPPTPTEAQPAPYGVQVGEVGAISFWAPNRGVLITKGNSLVPAGLYAYDGESWHELSNQCGGHDGRIAWAGPDEFWTISDQRPGQSLPKGGEGALWDVSLCRFENGAIVGSYAMPLEQPGSYETMDAAACDSANDCWFGGALDSAGAFHLHWNGSELDVVNGPQDHAIAAMTVYDESIYESVQLANGDRYAESEGEEPIEPFLLHKIVPEDLGEPFHDVQPEACPPKGLCTTLPEYGRTEGKKVAPVTLAGFALSSSWSPAAENTDPELWAAAGYDGITPANPTEEGEGHAHPIALRYANNEWTEVVPNLASFESGWEPSAVAAEPGESAAWVTLHSDSEGDEAHVARIQIEGPSSAKVVSETLGTAQGVGPRGTARAIACPATHECWLATKEGWLFHLTNGTKLPKDADPFFDGQDGVLEYRPPDDGTPQSLPFEPPENDSLADLQPPETGKVAEAVKPPAARKSKKAQKLVIDMRSRLIDRDTLQFSFKLLAKAHVQLIARRHKKTVASTRRITLAKGAHKLKLRLNPKRWPTKLDLQATALGGSKAPASTSNEQETVTT